MIAALSQTQLDCLTIAVIMVITVALPLFYSK